MELQTSKIGEYIANKRKLCKLTQAELSEQLGITSQSVSNWERGESLPDISILPDLALILHTTVDELLGGGTCEWIYKERTSVERMREAVSCLETLKNLLGANHFMYKTIINALDTTMNSSVENAFIDQNSRDAYVCEAIIEAVKNGAYIDINDVEKNIPSDRPREYTVNWLREHSLTKN